jgi:hypothetical protein
MAMNMGMMIGLIDYERGASYHHFQGVHLI